MLMLPKDSVNSKVIKFDIVHLLLDVCVVSSNVQIDCICNCTCGEEFFTFISIILDEKCLNMVESMVENK